MKKKLLRMNGVNYGRLLVCQIGDGLPMMMMITTMMWRPFKQNTFWNLIFFYIQLIPYADETSIEQMKSVPFIYSSAYTTTFTTTHLVPATTHPTSKAVSPCYPLQRASCWVCPRVCWRRALSPARWPSNPSSPGICKGERCGRGER